MYIFYQHHKDAGGKIVLTELKLSSYNTQWRIAFKDKREDALFGLLRIVLKYPPTLQRSYDDNTKIWSYLENWGTQVLERAVETTKSLGGIVLKELDDLQYYAAQTHFDLSKLRSAAPKPEDFFYQQAPAQSPELSRESLITKLSALLEVQELELSKAQNGELKKLYRHAAMRLHPDRNNGDGSRMSELNMLWRMYNA